MTDPSLPGVGQAIHAQHDGRAAAAFAAFANLPADADHDDVDRASHLWCGNAIGFILLAWWLVAISSGPEAYATVNDFFGSLLGRFMLFVFSWALIHHMLGGIRHLDLGYGPPLSTK